MIVSTIEVLTTEAGGVDAGGDNPDATLKEEKVYELAGSGLTLVSALLHGYLLYNLSRSRMTNTSSSSSTADEK